MNYNEFKNMTKKTNKRRLAGIVNTLDILCFKLKVSVLELLTRLNLIVKVEHKETKCVDTTTDDTPIILEDLVTSRFTYGISFVHFLFQYTDKLWYETKKGKRILTLSDAFGGKVTIDFRADLKRFETVMTAPESRDKEYFNERGSFQYLRPGQKYTLVLSNDCPTYYDSKGNRKTADFFKCRYACRVTHELHNEEDLAGVIKMSIEHLKGDLLSKVDEIAENLLGVDNIGTDNLVTREGDPLADNLICTKCGSPVFALNGQGYNYLCPIHYRTEYIRRVDSEFYKKQLEHFWTELVNFTKL